MCSSTRSDSEIVGQSLVSPSQATNTACCVDRLDIRLSALTPAMNCPMYSRTVLWLGILALHRAAVPCRENEHLFVPLMANSPPWNSSGCTKPVQIISRDFVYLVPWSTKHNDGNQIQFTFMVQAQTLTFDHRRAAGALSGERKQRGVSTTTATAHTTAPTRNSRDIFSQTSATLSR